MNVLKIESGLLVTFAQLVAIASLTSRGNGIPYVGIGEVYISESIQDDEIMLESGTYHNPNPPVFIKDSGKIENSWFV